MIYTFVEITDIDFEAGILWTTDGRRFKFPYMVPGMQLLLENCWYYFEDKNKRFSATLDGENKVLEITVHFYHDRFRLQPIGA